MRWESETRSQGSPSERGKKKKKKRLTPPGYTATPVTPPDLHPELNPLTLIHDTNPTLAYIYNYLAVWNDQESSHILLYIFYFLAFSPSSSSSSIASSLAQQRFHNTIYLFKKKIKIQPSFAQSVEFIYTHKAIKNHPQGYFVYETNTGKPSIL